MSGCVGSVAGAVVGAVVGAGAVVGSAVVGSSTVPFVTSVASTSTFVGVSVVSSQVPALESENAFEEPLRLIAASVLPGYCSPPFSEIITLVLAEVERSKSDAA